MPEQTRKPKPAAQEETSVEEPVKSEAAEAEELKSSLDDLLDEIDKVLEQNAEEFIAAYVQKGGE